MSQVQREFVLMSDEAHDLRARFCSERPEGEWVTGIKCPTCEAKTPEELDRLPSIDVSGTDRIYLDTEAMLASARKEGAVQALRDAAIEQRRLGRSPRALKSKAVAFKRELFASWLDERADRIEGR